MAGTAWLRKRDDYERINGSKINSWRNKVCYLIGSTFDLSSLNLNYFVPRPLQTDRGESHDSHKNPSFPRSPFN